MATNLSQDELINQLAQSDNRIEEYPNWRVNCQMFNSLTSSTSFTVLQCSKTSECVKVVDFLIDVAIGCCHGGNLIRQWQSPLGWMPDPCNVCTKSGKNWRRQRSIFSRALEIRQTTFKIIAKCSS